MSGSASPPLRPSSSAASPSPTLSLDQRARCCVHSTPHATLPQLLPPCVARLLHPHQSSLTMSRPTKVARRTRCSCLARQRSPAVQHPRTCVRYVPHHPASTLTHSDSLYSPACITGPRFRRGHRGVLFTGTFMLVSEVIFDDTYSNKSRSTVGKSMFILARPCSCS